MNTLNDLFVRHAQRFPDSDLPLREKVHTKKLDYSLKSLKEVDRYLQLLFAQQQPAKDSNAYKDVITFVGAYIGEVIRRHAVAEYHWVAYDDYMQGKDQDVQDAIPCMVGTHALLATADLKFMTLPLNKVARYLSEGKTQSVFQYASGDLIKKKP